MGRICPEVLEKKILKVANAFLLFCNYLPLGKGLDLHIKKMNPMLCAKFGWKYPSGSGKEDYKVFNKVFLLCCNYLHFDEGVTFQLKWTWIIFTQWCFVPSLVENGPVVLWKIFNMSMHFYYFQIISPLRRVYPFICINLNSLHPRMLVPILVKVGPVVLEKKIF